MFPAKTSFIDGKITLSENLRYCPIKYLDDTYDEVDSVPGLRTILYKHQKIIVKAMIDLENNKLLYAKDAKDTENVFIIDANAGILSEKVGSGKTFDILATIILNPKPASTYEVDRIINNFATFESSSYTLHEPFIYKKSFKYVLNPTLIFVGSSVIKQWISVIETYTNLKTFVVYGIKEFEKLVDIIVNKTVNDYDIILIKNGTVSRVVLPKNIKILPTITASPHMYLLLLFQLRCLV